MKAETKRNIVIGVAALLAIALSYVGVKALTKSSPKLRVTVAQASRPAEQQIATMGETAAPQIVTSSESVAPKATNFPTEPSITQNPAIEPGATQNVAPPNQEAAGNAAAASKPTGC